MTARTTEPFALSAEERAMCAHACTNEALVCAQRASGGDLAAYELVYYTERARLYATLAEELNAGRSVAVCASLALVANVVGKA